MTVESGTEALALLLPSYSLASGTRVLVSAFCCDAVRRAVQLAGLQLVLCDLKTEGSIVSDYLGADWKSQVGAAIVVHLYNAAHLDTESIAELCQEHGVKLLHDAAQSYGLDDALLTNGDGAVISFGPGKATTAACGGLVTGVSSAFYQQAVRDVDRHAVMRLLVNQVAHHFIRMRQVTTSERARNRACAHVMRSVRSRLGRKNVWSMTSYQRKAAGYAIERASVMREERIRRLEMIRGAVLANPRFRDAAAGLQGAFYKAVVHVKSDPDVFVNYLVSEGIPFYRPFDRDTLAKPEYASWHTFRATGHRFVEIPCEACLPTQEIERVARAVERFDG
jgi:dTDP-4-amino-4,6-dideoxygalactose transaminase